jgi:hypothetical protein
MRVSAKDCRNLAADCLRWADTAGHPDAHRAFVSMARTWTRTALELERSEVPALLQEPDDRMAL